MATYEQLIAKARELSADGRVEDARRVAQIAVKMRNSGPKKSMLTTLKENVMGDNDPNTQNFGEKLGSVLNKAGESMTFGLIGDEASAAAESMLPGVKYDDRLKHYRDQERILERNNPKTALAADIGGGLVGAVLPVGAVGAGLSLLPRIGASAATGAAMGGTYGFMEGEGLQDRAKQGKTGALIGGAVGAAAPAIGAGVKKAADNVVANRAIQRASKNALSSEDLKRLGRAEYKAIKDAGVEIKPEAFRRAQSDIMGNLRANTGFDELPGPGSLTPNSARVTQIMRSASDEMAGEPTAALPFSAVDQMRRQAGAAAGNVANKTDQGAGMTIIEGLDDFINRLGPDDVIAGDVRALKTTIPKAREIWSRMSKSQLIDDAIESEGNYLSGGSSAIRNQFAKILRNKKLSRGFNDAEKKAMQRVVQGTMPEQVLNLLGGGIGQLMTIGGGASVGGVPGGVMGAALAATMRKGSEAVTRRNAETARALVANGTLKSLPQSDEAVRLITEGLTRRIGAGQVQR